MVGWTDREETTLRPSAKTPEFRLHGVAARATPSRKRLSAEFAIGVFLALSAFGLLGQGSDSASAAAAPVAQCNNDTASNVGGQGISCTVTIENHVTGGGTLDAAAPSRVTVTRCTGAAGPIGAGAGTCATTVTTSAEPATQVQQCNGSGNGGGGVVICSVTVTNTFSTSPVSAATPATIYQCIGSVITGTGGPGSCTPANTPGVNSVSAATVGQCNGSGNGGTSVGFICTVSGQSTTTAALAVHIDQCNGSANGGGALLRCTATVTNVVAPSVPSTATPTATASSVPTTATVSPTPGTSTPGPGATSTPTGTPPSATATRTATPTSPVTGSPTPALTPPAGTTPLPPRPPATGNAGGEGANGASQAFILLLGIASIGLLAAGIRVVSRRSSR